MFYIHETLSLKHPAKLQLVSIAERFVVKKKRDYVSKLRSTQTGPDRMNLLTDEIIFKDSKYFLHVLFKEF